MEELLEKIKRIEALIEGAKTKGEKSAAIFAKGRINKRIVEQSKKEIRQSEFTLYTQDNWHKKLLLAICRKYGIQPYRYHRQKYTTVMVRIEEEFLTKVVWKEYLEYSRHLEILVEEVTDNLIKKIHEHSEEDVIQRGIE